LPIDCTDAEETLIWALVNPGGPNAIACCSRCLEQGIFNRPVCLRLTPESDESILNFLTLQRVPFRVVDPTGSHSAEDLARSVEFYPKQDVDFLNDLAALLQ